MSKILVAKFSADFCGACKTMKRARTLERFAESHPEVEVKDVWVTTEEDENGDMAEVEDAALTATQEADIDAYPTVIIYDTDGDEVARESGGMSLAMLEKFYKRAVKEMEAE